MKVGPSPSKDSKDEKSKKPLRTSAQVRPAQNNGKTAKDANNEKKTVYVYATKGAVFLITGEPKEGKYSYAIKISPLYGKFYDAKRKKTYSAKELHGANVLLNFKGDVSWVKKGLVVLWGYEDDEFVVYNPTEGKDDENNAGAEKGE